jgi:hypothetical protein
MECDVRLKGGSTTASIADILVKTLSPTFFIHFIDENTDNRTVTLAFQVICELLYLDQGNFCSKFASAQGYSLLVDGLGHFVKVPEIYAQLCALLLGTVAKIPPVPMDTLQMASLTWSYRSRGKSHHDHMIDHLCHRLLVAPTAGAADR